MPSHDIEHIIALILARNETLEGYLKDRLESVREIAAVSMDGPNKGMNLVILNAEGLLLNEHGLAVLRALYQPQYLCLFLLLHGVSFDHLDWVW
jgi:hypothetical protein